MARLRMLALVFWGLACGGCSTQSSWTYPYHPDRLLRFDRAYDVAIAVVPFEDARARDLYPWVRLYLAFIPFVPYSTATYNRPERTMQVGVPYFFDAPDDLGRAATESLRLSQLVKTAFFSLDGDPNQADFVLRGITGSTTYSQTMTLYGLSALGDLLWLLGLPTGKNRVELAITLRLEDHNGNEHWSFFFHDAKERFRIFYRMNGDLVLLDLPTLMESAMNSALQDLAPHLPELEREAQQARTHPATIPSSPIPRDNP